MTGFRTVLRKLSLSVSRAHGSRLTLMLLLAVLVPSACLVWFLTEAVKNERLAMRQKLADAYRGHLTLAQERLASYWSRLATDLDSQAGLLTPSAFFARTVNSGLADALIILDTNGIVLYPSSSATVSSVEMPREFLEGQFLESSDPIAAADRYAAVALSGDARIAAMALQAQARCLVQARNRQAALTILTGPLAEDRFLHETDLHGRWILPNVQLMVLELQSNALSAESQKVAGRLRAELLDYENWQIPPSQRRFLMRQLHALYPDQSLPLLAAEDLAARYLESQPQAPRDSVLRASALPEVWQFASKSGRIVTLHQTRSLTARMRRECAVQSLPADVQLDFLQPGREPEGSLVSIAAGLPATGWRLALTPRDLHTLNLASQQRISSYVWTGIFALAAVLLLALLAVGMVRRQVALTRLRNDLVANVTHELKTPLASMRLLVETLLGSPPPDANTLRDYLQLVARENLRLSRLIDNFLTFSRIERNKYTLDFKRIAAQSVLDDAVAVVRERFQTPGCHFQVQNRGNLPPIIADPDALVTALVNLLDNAWKYSGETKEIKLGATAENGHVVYSVSDNGIGLSPRDSRRIFKRFYQVNQHLAHSGGGAGIGLSIVQFVVSAHRGTIEVQSRPQSGSVFTIRIPAAEAQSLAESA